MLTKRTKRLCAWFAFIGLASGGYLLLHRPSMHPEFGEVYQSAMAEFPSAWQQVQYSFRKMIHLPTAERTWLLRIGDAPLQWSAGGGHRGFIYANDPLLSKTPLWEFALSTRTRLAEVRRSDLPSDYVGMYDPRGTNVFGSDWNGYALRVPEGQLFFARVATNRALVYVIRLAEQGQKRESMRVEYVAVKP